MGSSFGSNGDGAGLSLSHPASLNGHPPLVAGSLDAQFRRMVSMQSTGQTHLGMSPSAGGGGMWPLSQGPSPSHHLILPGPRFQASPASQQISSPGSPYLPSPGNLCDCIATVQPDWCLSINSAVYHYSTTALRLL